MLVLSRKEQQTLIIDDHIKVVVLQTSGRSVRIGIEAPPHVSIHRGEVHERIDAEEIAESQQAMNVEQDAA
jgi:carbon storage regulator